MSMSCYKSNINNPMGNFMPFDSRSRQPVCVADTAFDYPVTFHTMPVTESYQDSTAFAHFLFPNPARCRESGYLCMTNADRTVNLDRIIYQPLK